MAGNAAAANIEGFCYVAMDAFAQASISFTGQNYGAREYKRIDKIMIYTLILGTGSALLFGLPAYFFGGTLLKIFSTDPKVIELTCVCVFRVIWIFTIFRANHNLVLLYASYPITWFLAAVVGMIYYFMLRKRLFVETEEPAVPR